MPDFESKELDRRLKTSYMSTGKINEARIFKCKFSEKKCQVTLIQKNIEKPLQLLLVFPSGWIVMKRKRTTSVPVLIAKYKKCKGNNIQFPPSQPSLFILPIVDFAQKHRCTGWPLDSIFHSKMRIT